MLLACSACRLGFEENPAGADGPLPSDSYGAAVFADGPRAYFRFDEPAGPTASSAVGTLSGPYEGAFLFGKPGAIAGNPCVRFDGMTTRIPLGDVFRFGGNAPYSIELWINPGDIIDTRFILDRRTTSGAPDGYTFYLGVDYFLMARQAAGTEMAYVGDVPRVGVWTHAVVTYDGLAQRMYLDGVLVEQSNATGVNPIGEGVGELTIGDSHPGQFNKLDGLLDELAIYDRALTGVQVTAHFAAR
jgi:Concanavalin A-like lectin/glucanases superfamily